MVTNGHSCTKYVDQRYYSLHRATTFTVLDVFLFGLALVILRAWYSARGRALRPLPPGPKGLPIIGNLLDMPSVSPWITFAEWAKTWGDICSITIFGQTIVIINSAKVAADLLDKRSTIYSDRPDLPMAGLVGWGKAFTLTQYGSHLHKVGRKLSSRLMGTPAALKIYLPAQEKEARKFLRRVLAQPDTLKEQIHTTAGALILRIIYGYESQEHNDPLIHLTEESLDRFGRATAPGVWFVDVVPALRYVPAWMPGANFKRIAAVWAEQVVRYVNEPFNLVKEEMAAGTANASFTETLMEGNPTLEEEDDIKWTAATIAGGGADTTVGQQHAFFLAMILHPEVMHKAQAEIDALTNGERLPGFADREDLPYVNALVTELFRWHTLGPLGVAHRLREDDEYNGYFLPAGSIILPNTWYMTHNPDVYNEPLVFRPEHFLGPNPAPNLNHWFGFGRRVCPGMHLANTSVWIACAMSLAVFDISKALDQHGQPITPVHENITSTISHPKPFPYSIKPRSEKHAALIQSAAEE